MTKKPTAAAIATTVSPLEFRVKEILVELLLVDDDQVTPLATMEDLGMDSLDTVDLVMRLEEVYGFEISEDDVDSWKTVKDIIDYVASKVPA